MNIEGWPVVDIGFPDNGVLRMMFLGVVATIIGICCMVTALLDMGMNGARYASWAPWGIGIASMCFAFVWVMEYFG